MVRNASRPINSEVIHQKCITALRISSTLAVLISSTALDDYHPGDLYVAPSCRCPHVQQVSGYHSRYLRYYTDWECLTQRGYLKREHDLSAPTQRSCFQLPKVCPGGQQWEGTPPRSCGCLPNACQAPSVGKRANQSIVPTCVGSLSSVEILLCELGDLLKLQLFGRQ